MPDPPLPGGFDPDPNHQANWDELVKRIQSLTQFFSWGTGAPAHTPSGPQLYIRYDGGANTTLYVYEPTPAAWNPID